MFSATSCLDLRLADLDDVQRPALAILLRSFQHLDVLAFLPITTPGRATQIVPRLLAGRSITTRDTPAPCSFLADGRAASGPQRRLG
jgi:hypothetical protein